MGSVEPHSKSMVRVIRDNRPPITDVRGYLDAKGAHDTYLVGLIYDLYEQEIDDEETAAILHSEGYLTSRMYKKYVTGSNVCQFRLNYMGIRKHRAHEKRNYKFQNVVIHNGMRKKGIQDATQIAKYNTEDYSTQVGVMMTQNLVGRKNQPSEERLEEMKQQAKELARTEGRYWRTEL